MNKQSYWERINKIEGKIQELANKGLDYSAENNKRKSLITNVKRLEKEEQYTQERERKIKKMKKRKKYRTSCFWWGK